MPTCSFVPDVPFVWPPLAPEVPGGGLRPPTAPKPARAKPGPKPGERTTQQPKGKVRPAKRTIASSVRTIMIDRMENATLDGRIELNTEDMLCESLDMTAEELAFTLRVLLEDAYAAADVEAMLARVAKRKRKG